MTSVLFRASHLARWCAVDLKTIHNWTNDGAIPHIRTPGGQYRFKPADVRAFMEKSGYDVPDEVKEATAEKAA